MGGTTLVTKGILGPIEGDILNRTIELPLEVEYQVNEMMIALPDEILAEAELPDSVEAEVSLNEMDVEADFAELDVEIEVKED